MGFVRILCLLFLLSACTPALHSSTNPALEVHKDGEVHHEGVDSLGTFNEHTVVKDPMRADYIVGQAKANQRSQSTVIHGSGSTQNRVNFVIVGDGYASIDQAQYLSDSERIVRAFFEQEPLRTYKNYFNVHRVDVISEQTGVNNDPSPGVNRKNALGMNYYCSGIERLLCANISAVKAYAANAPSVDHILAVANSDKYGGAGYWDSSVATLAGRNSSSIELALHEVGHSFAKLGDEYEQAGSNPAECLKKANSTTVTANEMLRKSLKWFRWLDIPHIGAYEGTCYKSSGSYRPTEDSKMRTLGKPLYEVNTEQYIFAIYEKVRPIDYATAPGTYNSNRILYVIPMRPLGFALSIQWFLNQNEIAGYNAESLDVRTLNLPKGRHIVKAKVQDTTSRVRDEAKRTKLMTQEVSWTIVVDR